MITLERNDRANAWTLRAHGNGRPDQTPMIARIGGFDPDFHYQRQFLGSRSHGETSVWHITDFADFEAPRLLDIRHSDYGRWYILHCAPDFEHLQLTEVNQALMDHLVAQPLFSQHTIGSFRILDDDVDLPRERRRRRNGEVPEVIQSPVDTSPRQEYGTIVIHPSAQPIGVDGPMARQRVPADVRMAAAARMERWGQAYSLRAGRRSGHTGLATDHLDVACARCSHHHFNYGRGICAYTRAPGCTCTVYEDPRRPGVTGDQPITGNEIFTGAVGVYNGVRVVDDLRRGSGDTIIYDTLPPFLSEPRRGRKKKPETRKIEALPESPGRKFSRD